MGSSEYRRVETTLGVFVDIPESVCQLFLEYVQEANLIGVPVEKRPSDTWDDFRVWCDLKDEQSAVEWLTKEGKHTFDMTLLWFYIF